MSSSTKPYKPSSSIDPLSLSLNLNRTLPDDDLVPESTGNSQDPHQFCYLRLNSDIPMYNFCISVAKFLILFSSNTWRLWSSFCVSVPSEVNGNSLIDTFFTTMSRLYIALVGSPSEFSLTKTPQIHHSGKSPLTKERGWRTSASLTGIPSKDPNRWCYNHLVPSFIRSVCKGIYKQ